MRRNLYKLFVISLSLILWTGVFPQEIFAADILLSKLKTEYIDNPLGIDVIKPRFSWKLTSSLRAQHQSAYRILVASKEAYLNTDNGDMWDSRKASSDSTFGVEYNGIPLEKETRYYWKVKAWDGNNSPSDWSSESSWFEMGLLESSDWLGDWIGYTYGDVAPYLRTTFNINTNKTVKSARLYITACGYYEAHINGTRVGENVLDPGFTDYDKTNLYVTHDITNLLQSGENAIGVELGRGFYGLNTPNTWNWQRASWHGDPRMRCQIKIDYTDNTSEPYLYSNGSWKATAGPRYEDSIYAGDKYDARDEKPGWTTPSYDDNSWTDATVMSTPSRIVPDGYTYIAPEGRSVTFTKTVDVAYGANGQFNHRHDVTGTITFDNATFGDPIYGVGKAGFFKNVDPVPTGPAGYTYVADEGQSFTFSETVNVAYGANGKFNYMHGVTGTIIFDSATFGDLIQGVEKAGFFKSADSDVMKAQMMPPIKIVETINPVSVTNPDQNVWLFDFNITTAGWAKLTARAASGIEVKIRYGEYLEDGRVKSKHTFIDNGNDTNQTDHYTFRGGGAEETFEPKFSYKGYRYVEVIGFPGTMTISNLEGKVIHSDVQTIGDFSCSDALFNEIHEATRKTFLNNLHSIPTDTPMWEKNGWTGDAQLILETSMYNFDVATFFSKWLGDFKDSQKDNGAVPVVVPTGEWGYLKDPAWTGAYTLTAWNLFRFYGNRRILEDYYDSIKRFTEYIKDGTGGFSDWAVTGGGGKDELPERMYAIHLVDTMSKIAVAVENSNDATSYQSEFNNRKDMFNNSYLFNGNEYKLNNTAPFYQTNNVIPFQFKFVPEINKAAVILNVVNDVQNRDNHLHTGILGTKALMPALTEMGYNEVAYNIVKQETYPSWGYWFANGGTTLWEFWETNSRSRNHYMFGTVDQWFYEDIAGIQPDTPGFKTIKIKPEMFKKIDWAEASTDTIRGLVSSRWDRDANDNILLKVVIPPNTEAVVYVPAINESVVEEGGIPANSAVGVNFIQMDEHHAVYSVKSGTYNFTSSLVIGPVKEKTPPEKPTGLKVIE